MSHQLLHLSYGFPPPATANLCALLQQRSDLLVVMQIYMQYPFERTVQSVVKKSVFEGRGFGAKMTVEQLIAKQTRIERWESACCKAPLLLHHTVAAHSSLPL